MTPSANQKDLLQNPLSSPLNNRDPFNFDRGTGQRVLTFFGILIYLFILKFKLEYFFC